MRHISVSFFGLNKLGYAKCSFGEDGGIGYIIHGCN